MGYIHSLESFGSVDGPGVRFVVFFQGCPMRCAYCHNPDTWNVAEGQEMSADEILQKMLRNRAFYTTGGITATGGEPMMQMDFLIELFTKAKAEGIHTCLDTSGIMYTGTKEDGTPENAKIAKLMEVTELVMLDIKHMDEAAHMDLTAQSNKNILAFARYLDAIHKPVWIRHVVVPGITMQEESLAAVGRFLSTLSNVEKLEVLRYHALGKVKYEKLDMDYRLKDTPQLTKEEAAEAEAIIKKYWKKS
ncbi:MAG: pyruvate formate lyase-activating protein [Roseburia sp.]|nr:pyruvate formate lyase-activating protein [Roseburia sp.]